MMWALIAIAVGAAGAGFGITHLIWSWCARAYLTKVAEREAADQAKIAALKAELANPWRRADDPPKNAESVIGYYPGRAHHFSDPHPPWAVCAYDTSRQWHYPSRDFEKCSKPPLAWMPIPGEAVLELFGPREGEEVEEDDDNAHPGH